MSSRERSPYPSNDPKVLSGPQSGSHYGTLQLSQVSSDCKPGMRNRRDTSRCVTKAGECNFRAVNIAKQRWKFASDSFTTLLEVRWRWTLFCFGFTYFGSWTLFAVVWYLILYFHGDLEPENYGNPAWRPCITEIPNFTTAFLFSVETQHTTGYGFYKLGDECAHAIITLCIQSIVGVILEGLMVGLVFAKIARSKKRCKTLMFSRYAVICQRDGKLCFMFRVGDMRTKSHLLDARVRAQLIRKRVTLEGETIQYHQEELKLSSHEGMAGKVLLFWPTAVVHTIDSSSPLYHLCPADLTVHNNALEVIVVLEGIVESTGQTAQARSSYLPSEIIWGHRLQDMQSVKSPHTGERMMDYSLFHEIYPVTTTTLSAADMDSSLRLSYS